MQLSNVLNHWTGGIFGMFAWVITSIFRLRQCRRALSATRDAHTYYWPATVLCRSHKDTTGVKWNRYGRWSHQLNCCSTGPGRLSRRITYEEHKSWSPGQWLSSLYCVLTDLRRNVIVCSIESAGPSVELVSSSLHFTIGLLLIFMVWSSGFRLRDWQI